MKTATLSTKKAREIRASCFCAPLRRTARLVTQVYDDALRPLEITANQMEILMILLGHGEQRIGSLANMIGAEQSTISRNLDSLEKRDLLTIEIGTDKRARVVKLAAPAKTLLIRALPLWREAQDLIKIKIGEESMNRLISDLKLIETPNFTESN